MAGSGGFEPPYLGPKPSRIPSYLTSPKQISVRGSCNNLIPVLLKFLELVENQLQREF